MANNAIREYRLDQLHGDAMAIDDFAARLRGLITDLRFDAKLCEDRATGEAMETLADDLRDAAHGPFSSMTAAHEGACDEEGKEPLYALDSDDARVFGMRPARFAFKALS